MNILLVDQFGEIGGAQKCLLDLIAGWREPGRLILAAPSGGDLANAATVMGVEAHVLPCSPSRPGKKTPSDAWRFGSDLLRQRAVLRHLIETRSVDICYVNGPRVLAGAALAAARSCPLVFHAHNRLRHASEVAVVRLALRHCRSRAVACCEYVAEPLRKSCSCAVRVILNGVPDLGLRARSWPIARICRIGVVGRISPEKGHTVLFDAVRMLTSVGHRIALTVAGTRRFSSASYESEVYRSASGLDVQFTGWIDDVSSVLARLDVLAVPSLAESGLPRVVLEAFSAGVPVVALPTGGIPEAIRDGETGFLASGTASADLAAALRRVLGASLVKMEYILRQARAEWEAHWNVDRWRGEVMAIIRSAASLAQRAAA